MLFHRIRRLRQRLSKLVEAGHRLTDTEVLAVSRQIDRLVCQVMQGEQTGRGPKGSGSNRAIADDSSVPDP